LRYECQLISKIKKRNKHLFSKSEEKALSNIDKDPIFKSFIVRSLGKYYSDNLLKEYTRTFLLSMDKIKRIHGSQPFKKINRQIISGGPQESICLSLIKGIRNAHPDKDGFYITGAYCGGSLIRIITSLNKEIKHGYDPVEVAIKDSTFYIPLSSTSNGMGVTFDDISIAINQLPVQGEESKNNLWITTTMEYRGISIYIRIPTNVIDGMIGELGKTFNSEIERDNRAFLSKSIEIIKQSTIKTIHLTGKLKIMKKNTIFRHYIYTIDKGY